MKEHLPNWRWCFAWINMLRPDMLSTDRQIGMDTYRPPRRFRRPRSLTLVIVAAMLLAVGGSVVASAGAASSIEGVWSFGGGQIAVQPEGNGKFEGIVVSPTTFATCTHPDGQQIWKEMTLQPDGSYFGSHQWYYENSGCTENPNPGPTAWRVIEESSGSHYLRVCLSEPGKSQPTISPGSAGIGASYGCVSSALIAPLPTTSGSTSGTSTGSDGSSGTKGSKESLSLPSAKQCLSVRLFKIHLSDPKYDPFKTVSVTIKGRKFPTARKGKYIVATINLKGLPKGAFTVKIKATTVLGHSLSASRTYHTCKKKSNRKG
jgi:hypothetical protein